MDTIYFDNELYFIHKTKTNPQYKVCSKFNSQSSDFSKINPIDYDYYRGIVGNVATKLKLSDQEKQQLNKHDIYYCVESGNQPKVNTKQVLVLCANDLTAVRNGMTTNEVVIKGLDPDEKYTYIFTYVGDDITDSKKDRKYKRDLL